MRELTSALTADLIGKETSRPFSTRLFSPNDQQILRGANERRNKMEETFERVTERHGGKAKTDQRETFDQVREAPLLATISNRGRERTTLYYGIFVNWKGKRRNFPLGSHLNRARNKLTRWAAARNPRRGGAHSSWAHVGSITQKISESSKRPTQERFSEFVTNVFTSKRE
jgi:hypothetical protein